MQYLVTAVNSKTGRAPFWRELDQLGAAEELACDAHADGYECVHVKALIGEDRCHDVTPFTCPLHPPTIGGVPVEQESAAMRER